MKKIITRLLYGVAFLILGIGALSTLVFGIDWLLTGGDLAMLKRAVMILVGGAGYLFSALIFDFFLAMISSMPGNYK